VLNYQHKQGIYMTQQDKATAIIIMGIVVFAGLFFTALVGTAYLLVTQA